MEISKVGQAKFMEWDEQMALDKSNVGETGMRAKTSNLNEDLGKVSLLTHTILIDFRSNTFSVIKRERLQRIKWTFGCVLSKEWL
jgi:hypothetical protein